MESYLFHALFLPWTLSECKDTSKRLNLSDARLYLKPDKIEIMYDPVKDVVDKPSRWEDY